ncbi:MAG: porin family protein [Alphaproteobacteria bacterium]|nr:porin family protein [Alphaproteobacteria bacterium]
MKTLSTLSFVLAACVAGSASAQYYGTYMPNDGQNYGRASVYEDPAIQMRRGYTGQDQAYYGAQNNTAQAVEQRSLQSYNFYQEPAETKAVAYAANGYGTSQLSNYPATSGAAGYQAYPGYVTAAGVPVYYGSPVYDQQKIAYKQKKYYADFHLGAGGTFSIGNGLDSPTGGVWGVTVGTYLKNNLRADVEFNYHMNGKLGKEGRKEIKYKQYDLGANLYYDMPTNAYVVKPFLGVGIWGVKGKANGSYKTNDLDLIDGKKFAVSLAGGATYDLTPDFSLFGMLRARYIFCDEDVYNLEGLLGIRYYF